MPGSTIFFLGGRQSVAADACAVAGQDDAAAIALTIQVLLGQILILQRIAGDHDRVALADNLQGLLFASDHGDDLVAEQEVVGANLVALRQSEDGGTIELAIISWYFGL